MAEYIEREAAIEAIKKERDYTGKFTFEEEHAWAVGFQQGITFALSDVANIPAADVRPVVMGTWRQIGPKEAVCSVCNNVTLTNGIDRTGHANIHKALYHFCPNCGADMREGCGHIRQLNNT